MILTSMHDIFAVHVEQDFDKLCRVETRRVEVVLAQSAQVREHLAALRELHHVVWVAERAGQHSGSGRGKVMTENERQQRKAANLTCPQRSTRAASHRSALALAAALAAAATPH